MLYFKKNKKLFCLKDSAAKKKNFKSRLSICFGFVLFLAAPGLHWTTRGFSSCGEWEPLFAEVHGLLLRSFSCCGAQAVGARASVAAQLGLSRCGAWAWLPRGMWDLPEPGMEPTSPALAGRFLATGSPGRPYISFNDYDFEHIYVYHGAFLVAVAWMVTNLPAVPDMWVQSLGPLEEDMTTHSSLLVWRIPWTVESGRLQSMGHKELDMT